MDRKISPKFSQQLKSFFDSLPQETRDFLQRAFSCTSVEEMMQGPNFDKHVQELEKAYRNVNEEGKAWAEGFIKKIGEGKFYPIQNPLTGEPL